jgi:predicted anti-sigma-YlaC factor YlaD
MSRNHIVREDIHLYVDGELPSGHRGRVEVHLKECSSCALAAAELERIGKAVRCIPSERTSAGFTATVLHELRLAPSPRRSFRGLESAGALVAMVVVAGVLLSVFFATGVLKQAQVAETQSATGMLLTKGGEAVADGANAVGGWVAMYLPFAFGKGVLGISITAVVMIALLAVIDRFAGRRLLHRVE